MGGIIIKIYVFLSKNVGNIEIAIKESKWAIGKNEKIKNRIEDVKVESFGIIYCSETEEFTMPFIIKSKPEDTYVDDIWEERMYYPFDIVVLGTKLKGINKAKVAGLKTVKNSDKSRWNTHFNIGVGQFLEKEILEEDWEYLFTQLAD